MVTFFCCPAWEWNHLGSIFSSTNHYCLYFSDFYPYHEHSPQWYGQLCVLQKDQCINACPGSSGFEYADNGFRGNGADFLGSSHAEPCSIGPHSSSVTPTFQSLSDVWCQGLFDEGEVCLIDSKWSFIGVSVELLAITNRIGFHASGCTFPSIQCDVCLVGWTSW